MKKKFFFLLLLSSVVKSQAQQLPDYSHYPSQLFMLNPAYTGTKENIDARLDYRKQWTGFDGAPIEKGIGIHSRFLKGKVGAGALIYKDVTGPSQRRTYGFSAAYHLRFPDVEFSAGIGINFTKYTFDGSQISIHNTHDMAIDRSITDFDKVTNASAGILLYNDRFHFGLGVVNVPDTKIEFYVADTSKKGTVNYAQHYYFSVGYNFSGNPDYVWENNLLTTYVSGTPLTLNYNLRIHYREKIIFGGGLRLKDAVTLQAGFVLFENYQVLYGYDFGISKLRSAHSNTHEILLAYRHNFEPGGGRKYRGGGDFQHQRYHLF